MIAHNMYDLCYTSTDWKEKYLNGTSMSGRSTSELHLAPIYHLQKKNKYHVTVVAIYMNATKDHAELYDII